eukprot:SAG31_NODE_3059_length_4678_cov_1.833657_4_plen_151_part_00
MVWVPIVPVDEAGGAMHFVPGSHRRSAEVLVHRPAPRQTMNPLTGNCFDELEVCNGTIEDSWERSVAVPLAAGGAAFWVPRTLHGSAANTTDQPRKALLMGARANAGPVPLEIPFDRPWRALRQNPEPNTFNGRRNQQAQSSSSSQASKL